MRVAIVGDGEFLSLYELHSALTLTVIDLENDEIIDKVHISFDSVMKHGLVQFLCQRNISSLIIGHISNRQKEFCKQKGIHVITGITGRIEDVIVWFSNTFMMREESLAIAGI